MNDAKTLPTSCLEGCTLTTHVTVLLILHLIKIHFLLSVLITSVFYLASAQTVEDKETEGQLRLSF